MKKYCLYFLCCPLALLGALPGIAQKSSLEMYRTFGGTHFEYTKDTMVYAVSPKQVSQILMDDPLAYQEFKKARSKATISGLMGFVGGVLIGIPAGTAIAGGDPEWPLAAAGIAFIGASIPLNGGYRRHAQNAIDMYNKNHTAFRPHVEYFLSGLGAKIVIRF